ncbi:polysaccharide pyruvyl transferase family protein [Blautia hansenii]|mgnify:CR=1 FL=1|uniref:polysaccharide pyruvyl transferase family protein n=1 Tax=Blautia hansenii TaxID=1322 RepID=UPI0032C05FFB
MKKIGILTFHKVPNYGASLQAFSLMNYIQKICSDDKQVVLLDYSCHGNSNEFEPNNRFNILSRNSNRIIKVIKRGLYEIKFGKSYRKKYKAFKEFSDKHLNIDDISDENSNVYECIFLGSDQIWNPKITNGYQKAYFGNDRNIDSLFAASYAASCGDIDELTIDEKKDLLKLIQNVRYVGVREKSFYDWLKKSGVSCTHTIDPSFLLESDDYNKLLNITITNEEQYVLEYALQNDKELDLLAKKIAKDKGIKVKKICGYMDFKAKKGKGIFDAGVIEFLSLLANSQYVVTNSFHGVAFSLIYKKNFYVILPVNRRSRILDLLEGLGIQDRLKYSNSDQMMDYKKIEPKLQDMIDESKNYICNILGAEFTNE